MIYKLQSPRMSPSGIFTRVKVQNRGNARIDNASDVHVLRSWYEYDSQAERRSARGRFNWNAVLGIVVVVAVSSAFWAGVGMLVARIWK
jgi:hypothetical protein